MWKVIHVELGALEDALNVLERADYVIFRLFQSATKDTLFTIIAKQRVGVMGNFTAE